MCGKHSVYSEYPLHFYRCHAIYLFYAEVFLNIFYVLTANLGRWSHIWGAPLTTVTYIFLNWLWHTLSPSWRTCATLLLYAKLGGVTTEMLLYNRGLSVILQKATNEHFKSLFDICCFPLVERLYNCMNNCQKSFDIVVKLLTLPSSDFSSFFFKNFL